MATFLSTGVKSVARSKAIALTTEKPHTAIVVIKKPLVLNSSKHCLIANSLAQLLPLSTKPIASCGISIGHGFRGYHADVAKVPSFDDYRLKQNKDPKSNSFQSEMDRKFYLYSMALGCTVMGTVAAKYTIKTFLWTLGPGINAKQAGKVEVKLDAIPEGKNLVIKWRSKPLFIRHRSQEEIVRERAVPLNALRDPERDEDRVKEDKWLICLGVCTHLGCIPLANAGDYVGGYYCPCHGSHYDASGRIRKGPAPKNLEVPTYEFAGDNVVVVG